MPLTDDPNDPELRVIDPFTNMQLSYLVLSEEDRARGFVRPVRLSYRHVGPPPPDPANLRDLTPEETERYGHRDYVAFDVVNRWYWTRRRLDGGCNAVTTMSVPLAETYAREPTFYGGTYCAGCRQHYPVGPEGEFVWKDTEERVGT